MKRVLFPIDGSEQSGITMQWGSHFFSRQNHEIYLLIVAESLDIDYSEERMQRILDEGSRLFQDRGFTVARAEYLINQKASDAICWSADRNRIDYIVMGAQGTQLSRLIIGSVSREVMQHARQPVLVLQNDRRSALKISRPESLTLRGGSMSREESLQVLVPVDSSSSADLLLGMLEQVLNPDDGLHLLYVIPRALPRVPETPRDIETSVLDATRLLEANRVLLESRGYRVINMEYRLGDPAEQICQYADEKALDQIVMASRNRSNLEKFLLGNVSADVFSHARQPVFLFSLGPKTVLSISHSPQLGSNETG